MADTVTIEPTAPEPEQLLAEIRQAFAEMDSLREQVRRDSRAIEIARAETAANLTSLDAILRRLAE